VVRDGWSEDVSSQAVAFGLIGVALGIAFWIVALAVVFSLGFI